METSNFINEVERIISADPGTFGVTRFHDGFDCLEDIARQDRSSYSGQYYQVIHRHGGNIPLTLPDWATEPHTKTEAQLFSGDDISRNHKAEKVITLRRFWFRDDGRELAFFVGQCPGCSRIVYGKEK